MKRIYALLDTVADAMMGQLVVERHDAPMIRMFHDLCGDPKTAPGQHPADFTLVCVGSITEQGVITPEATRVVATGAAWLAAQSTSNT